MLPLRDNVPTRTFPVVTVSLIAANAVVFLWQVQRLDERTAEYSYYPCSIVGSCVPAAEHVRRLPWYESAFTSMFMHGGWLHILGNMLFLWIFGNNVEDALGRVRFLCFYVLGGLAATALQSFVTIQFSGPAGESVPTLGASGAIAAVLGGYFVLLPRAKVLTWIVIVIREVPAFLFLGAWFLLQLYDGSGAVRVALEHPQAGGGVAFFAHVGGFAFGAAAVRLFQTRQPLRPRW